jgi:uncharacterized protein YneR
VPTIKFFEKFDERRFKPKWFSPELKLATQEKFKLFVKIRACGKKKNNETTRLKLESEYRAV